jgi:thiol:disulfide interchange protein
MNNKISMPWGLITLLAIGAIMISMLYKSPPGVGSGEKSAIPWQTDFDAAKSSAEAAGKPLLVDAFATWCGPCQEMAQTTWKDASVAKALEGYVPVSLDTDANAMLAMKYNVSVVPTLMVIDPKTGNVIKRSEGALDAEAFKDWLSSASGS